MVAKKPPEERIGTIPPFGLRMLPSLKARIEDAARASGRSMNAEIVARLIFSFEMSEMAERQTKTREEQAESTKTLGAMEKFTHALTLLSEAIKTTPELMELLKGNTSELVDKFQLLFKEKVLDEKSLDEGAAVMDKLDPHRKSHLKWQSSKPTKRKLDLGKGS